MWAARSAAPSGFTAPAPCVRTSVFGRTYAVYSRMALTASGMSGLEGRLPVGFNHERDDAGCDAGGHARPAQRNQAGVLGVGAHHDAAWIGLVQPALVCRIGDQLVSRCNDVRLLMGVEPRRSSRAVRRNGIVVARRRAPRVERPHSDG